MLKNVLNNFQMSEQYWGCLDKMSEVNFSPAESLTLAYECADPRCQNLTKCIQGVNNSLTNTIVCVNTTIFEIFTPSLFLYCFGNLTITG